MLAREPVIDDNDPHSRLFGPLPATMAAWMWYRFITGRLPARWPRSGEAERQRRGRPDIFYSNNLLVTLKETR